MIAQIGDTGLGAELPDQSRFRMEGWIMPSVYLIFIGEHNIAVLHQHCAERLVAVLHRELGEPYLGGGTP